MEKTINIITEMIDIINHQNETVKNLINVTLDEKTAILSNNITTLQDLLKMKENIVADINNYENLRMENIGKFSSHANLNGNPTMQEVYRYLADKLPDMASELLDITTVFAENYQQLSTLTKENEEILKISLDYVETLLYFSENEKSGVYTSDGLSEQPLKNLINKRV